MDLRACGRRASDTDLLKQTKDGRPSLSANAQFYFLLLVCSIVSLSFSFIMPTKPRGPEWDNFYRPWKVRCKYCTWEHLGRPAKMQKHLDNRWVTKNPELQSVGGSSSSSSSSLFFSPKSESPSLAEPPLKKKGTCVLCFQVHRPFSSSQQTNAVRKLALAAIATSTPFHALEIRVYFLM